MKKSIIWFIVMGLPVWLSAQARFITTDNWSTLLEKATEEKRLIFVDAYTDWCGWCKVMDRQTFADSVIGSIMNKEFVNVKLEMEKDSLGILIARKYVVTSFPTFLVFNQEGVLLKQIRGYMAPESFIKELQSVLAMNREIVRKGYSRDFNVRYPEFYAKSMMKKSERKMADSTLVARYFMSHVHLSQEGNWAAFQRFHFWLKDETIFRFFQQSTMLSTLYGADMLREASSDILGFRMSRAAAARDSARFFQMAALYGQHVDTSSTSDQELSLFWYRQTGGWNQIREIGNKLFMDSTYSRYSLINEVSWELYEKCDDQEVLKQACIWMQRVMAYEGTYNNTDTYAALLYKTGQYGEALKWADIALERARKEDNKAEETVKLKALIEKKLK